MIKAVLAAGGVGLGVGAAGRSLLGLFSGRSSPLTSRVSTGAAMPGMVHIPSMEEEEETRPFRKAASVLLVELSQRLSARRRPLEQLSSEMVKIADDDIVTRIADAIPFNIRSANPTQSTFGMPAIAGAGAGGLAGGWSLVDWLLKKQRRSQQTSDVDAAKKDYQQALREQYLVALHSKRAGATSTYGDLDAVYDSYANTREKQAINKWDLLFPGLWPQVAGGTDFSQQLQGALMTMMLGTAGGSAYGTYKWAKGRNNQKMLEKAIQLRARRRAGPQSLYAIPTRYDDEEI